MIESFHRNELVSCNNSDISNEHFEGFHSYEAKYRNLSPSIRTRVRKNSKGERYRIKTKY